MCKRADEQIFAKKNQKYDKMSKTLKIWHNSKNIQKSKFTKNLNFVIFGDFLIFYLCKKGNEQKKNKNKNTG